MNERALKILKLVTPPVIYELASRVFRKTLNQTKGLTGQYSNWEQALKQSSGYNSQIILNKTKFALLKVKKGQALYERDSVLFNAIEYSWPMLAGLMWAASFHKGILNVLDFGGSLGSTYFQNRYFLNALPQVRWNIVEQPQYTDIGKEMFEDGRLYFYSNISECLAATTPNIILLSSVLQYLEHPDLIFKELSQLTCDTMIIDRTPFWDGAFDRLCVQTVPPEIYTASYPSWIFSKSKFLNIIQKWKIIASFENPDHVPGPVKFDYQGMILVRQD